MYQDHADETSTSGDMMESVVVCFQARISKLEKKLEEKFNLS